MRNPKLVPYKTIVRAASGDPENIDEVLRHYGKRIRLASLENGQVNKDPRTTLNGGLSLPCFVWQFSDFGGVRNEREMKKFLKIPAYSDLCGVVRNKGKFPQINVHFAFCGFIGIRGRNVSTALVESPPRPSRVSENSMRYFRLSAHFVLLPVLPDL